MKKGVCSTCPSYCCKYITVPLETPRAYADFDRIHWYLMHPGTEVYVDEGDWMLLVKGDCAHLRDNRCVVHGHHPHVCRDYDVEGCDQTRNNKHPSHVRLLWTRHDAFSIWMSRHRKHGARWRREHPPQRGDHHLV